MAQSALRLRAIRHFCWLPPLSLRIGVSGPGVRTPSRRTSAPTMPRSRASSSSPLRRKRGQPRDRDVEGDALRQEAAFGLAVLRQQHDAGGGSPRADWPAARVAPSSCMSCASRGIGADQRAQQLGAARARHAANAEDLAGADVEIDVVRARPAATGPRTVSIYFARPAMRAPDRCRPAGGRPSCGSAPADRPRRPARVPTTAPSRSTVTRSQMRNTSCSRCEM